jgi:hypothetical protein
MFIWALALNRRHADELHFAGPDSGRGVLNVRARFREAIAEYPST